MNPGKNISPLFDRSGNLTPDAMKRYLSGILSPAESKAVEAHLESSPFDREALEGLRKHPAMNVGQVVAGLDAKIRQAALQKAAASPKPVIRRYYWAAAAGLVGLVGLTVLLVFMFRAPSSQQFAVGSSQSAVDSQQSAVSSQEPVATTQEEATALNKSSVDSRQSTVTGEAQKPVATTKEEATALKKPAEPVATTQEEATELHKSSVDSRQSTVTGEAQKPVATTKEEATALKKPTVDNQIVGGIAVADEAKIATDDVSAQEPETAEMIAFEMASNSPQDTIKRANANSAEKKEPFLVVEQMPEFPGGEEKLYKYLQKNIQYPDSAKVKGIQGTVYVRFIVDDQGKISEVTLLRGIGGGCDEEAMRVVKLMPDWIPGKQNGKAIPVYFTLPIKFTLQDK
jgi:TonB family protein